MPASLGPWRLNLPQIRVRAPTGFCQALRDRDSRPARTLLMSWHREPDWITVVPRRRRNSRGRTIVQVTYDIVNEDYTAFITDLRVQLAVHRDPDNVKGHPVLARQGRDPERWMHIHLLLGNDGEAGATTLAVRDDNVYLIGFRNKERRWYEFGIDGESARVLPAEAESIFLGCEFDYKSLIGGAYNLESDVDLCKRMVIETVGRLSEYTKPANDIDDVTREDLARLIVVVCESARMIPHHVKVSNCWQQGADTVTMLNEQQVRYMMNWGNMSQALLEWKSEEFWPHDLTVDVDVHSADETLKVVKLLLNRRCRSLSEIMKAQQELEAVGPPDGQPEQEHSASQRQGPSTSQPRSDSTQWRGQLLSAGDRGGSSTSSTHRGRQAFSSHGGHPLLEVFRVRAKSRVDGTIAVFDGMRGQILYNPNASTKEQAVLQIHSTVVTPEADRSPAKWDKSEKQRRRRRRLMLRFRTLISVLFNVAVSSIKHQKDNKGTSADADTIPNSKSQGRDDDLVLTGPHIVISASGSVSIEIDYIQQQMTTVSDEDDGTMSTLQLWGCDSHKEDDDSDTHAVYDELRIRTIDTAHGPIEVTYAVFSNAVQATVQVKLALLAGQQGALAADDIPVHGRITARVDGFDADIMLFSSGSTDEEKVVVTRDSLVPLARSVVAVPLSSRLLIQALVSSSKQPGMDVDFNAVFEPKPSGEQSQRFHTTRGDVVDVNISWGES